jgi:hypothetical protein
MQTGKRQHLHEAKFARRHVLLSSDSALQGDQPQEGGSSASALLWRRLPIQSHGFAPVHTNQDGIGGHGAMLVKAFGPLTRCIMFGPMPNAAFFRNMTSSKV